MCAQYKLIIFLLFLFYLIVEISSKFEYTNVVCTSLDKKFADFEYCYIKSVNRSYKYLSVKVNLFKTPITKIKMNGALFKRFNGYRPFMFNTTFDVCRFLKNTNSNAVANYFFSIFKDFSNMNHTCPYDHDLLLDKLSIDFVNTKATKVLPFPEGDYLVEAHWIANDLKRSVVKIYGTIS